MSEVIEPLTEEERMFYATLPAHLGKVRMARVVALVDALTEALEAAEVDRCAKCFNAEHRAMKAEARVQELEQMVHDTRSDRLTVAESELAALREELRRAKLDPVARVCEDADRLREEALRGR